MAGGADRGGGRDAEGHRRRRAQLERQDVARRSHRRRRRRRAVVHTDDIAWHQSVFDWVDLLLTGVLEPVRAGRAVAFRPPKWDERGRDGFIEVAAGAPLVVVEGVGAARPGLCERYDLSIWVESPPDVVAHRNADRVAAGELTESDFARWMAEEEPFMASARTWERTDVVAAGTPVVPHDPVTEIVVADAGPKYQPASKLRSR